MSCSTCSRSTSPRRRPAPQLRSPERWPPRSSRWPPRARTDWPEAKGIVAQAAARRARLTELAGTSADALSEAVEALERKREGRGSAAAHRRAPGCGGGRGRRRGRARGASGGAGRLAGAPRRRLGGAPRGSRCGNRRSSRPRQPHGASRPAARATTSAALRTTRCQRPAARWRPCDRGRLAGSPTAPTRISSSSLGAGDIGRMGGARRSLLGLRPRHRRARLRAARPRRRRGLPGGLPPAVRRLGASAASSVGRSGGRREASASTVAPATSSRRGGRPAPDRGCDGRSRGRSASLTTPAVSFCDASSSDNETYRTIADELDLPVTAIPGRVSHALDDLCDLFAAEME